MFQSSYVSIIPKKKVHETWFFLSAEKTHVW